MRYFTLILATICMFATMAQSKPGIYDGPEVTRVVVMKKARKLYLLHNTTIIAKFKIDLGFDPVGDKAFEGDGRTPEGRYLIDRRNPNSAFHLSLGISYPNDRDRAQAQAAGRPPGGDIFIHGARRRTDPRGRDWTAGCIAVSDRAVEKIYRMVKVGTVIDILP